MIILPAIDILNGQAVRLYQGDYATAHKVAADPVETALSFQSAGAEYLHIVDLSGAKDGSASGIDTVKSIVSALGIKPQSLLCSHSSLVLRCFSAKHTGIEIERTF